LFPVATVNLLKYELQTREKIPAKCSRGKTDDEESN
jgi:hypothetical protein